MSKKNFCTKKSKKKDFFEDLTTKLTEQKVGSVKRHKGLRKL